MKTADKTALWGIMIGVGAAVIGAALPAEFPNVAPIVWHFLFWGGLAIISVGSVVLIDDYIFHPKDYKARILIPCVVAALYSSFFTYRFSVRGVELPSMGAPVVAKNGTGGNGGSVSTVSGGATVALGSGGEGGCGEGVGGQGGGAGDISGSGTYVRTGNGGNAGGCEGRGGKAAPSPAESEDQPTYFWQFGRGGVGANAAAYNRRLSILTQLRQQYVHLFPDDELFINAGVDQVPVHFINKRLEEIGETWRVKLNSDGGYILPDLTPRDGGITSPIVVPPPSPMPLNSPKRK